MMVFSSSGLPRTIKNCPLSFLKFFVIISSSIERCGSGPESTAVAVYFISSGFDFILLNGPI
nr:hypothetical protein [uncultured bacterium]